jgi:hypothetical protein
MEQLYMEQPYMEQPYMEQPYMGQPFMGQPFMEQPYMKQLYMEHYFKTHKHLQIPLYGTEPKGRGPQAADSMNHQPQDSVTNYEEKST